MEEVTKTEEKKEETTKEKEEVTPAPPMPPLEAAARRLERLLGGGLSEKDRDFHTYTNPAKIVRRWLGTASGASGNATFDEISAAAAVLLDPEGPCATGRQLLILDNDGAVMEVEGSSKPLGYLTKASSREVESWLMSLSIRLLWKEKKHTDTFDLVQRGITILLDHLNIASTKLTSISSASTSSLFPLLARMYRYRSLVAEGLKDTEIDASLRQDMVKAHNMACLRRDVDSQATLLNIMLADLLNHSQSKCKDTPKRVTCVLSIIICSHLISPCLFACSFFSRTSPKVAFQFDVPRIGVQQPTLSLLVSQWSYPSVAFGIYQGLLQPRPESTQGTHQYWIGLSHCRATLVGRGATTHGRNPGTERIFHRRYADRNESLFGHYPSCQTGRSHCLYQGRFGTLDALAARWDLYSH